MNFIILFENDDIVVVSKLTPIPVISDQSGTMSLTELVRNECMSLGRLFECCEPAHRLDRPVSGLVVFAKNKLTLQALSSAFRERRVDKRYIAAVSPPPTASSAKLKQLIGWNKTRAKAFLANIDPSVRGGKIRRDMKEAVLEYQNIAMGDRYAILEIKLETGRHHQIRAQLAGLGSPVKGDVKYGARRPNSSGLISLHAWKVTLPKEFAVPTLVAPLPIEDGIWSVIDTMPI